MKLNVGRAPAQKEKKALLTQRLQCYIRYLYYNITEVVSGG